MRERVLACLAQSEEDYSGNERSRSLKHGWATRCPVWQGGMWAALVSWAGWYPTRLGRKTTAGAWVRHCSSWTRRNRATCFSSHPRAPSWQHAASAPRSIRPVHLLQKAVQRHEWVVTARITASNSDECDKLQERPQPPGKGNKLQERLTPTSYVQGSPPLAVQSPWSKPWLQRCTAPAASDKGWAAARAARLLKLPRCCLHPLHALPRLLAPPLLLTPQTPLAADRGATVQSALPAA